MLGRKKERWDEGGGGDGEKKIRTAGYRFSRRSSLSHNTTQFACPVSNLYQLVRTLETLLEQAVFLGCLPSQVSYNQNSVTLML